MGKAHTIKLGDETQSTQGKKITEPTWSDQGCWSDHEEGAPRPRPRQQRPWYVWYHSNSRLVITICKIILNQNFNTCLPKVNSLVPDALHTALQMYVYTYTVICFIQWPFKVVLLFELYFYFYTYKYLPDISMPSLLASMAASSFICSIKSLVCSNCVRWSGAWWGCKVKWRYLSACKN